MSTTITYWIASFEVEANGMGRMRSGVLGNFDSREKAQQRCQDETNRIHAESRRLATPLQWHTPSWSARLQADSRSDTLCFDAQMYFVDRVELIIE